MKTRLVLPFLLATLLALFAGAGRLDAATCTDAACVQVSGRLASIDLSRSILLNALVGGLLGSNVSLTLGDWQAIAAADINLFRLLQAVQADASLVTPDAAFGANVSALELFQATAAALTADGKTVAASAMNKLAAQVGGSTSLIRLSDLLDICSSCSDYADVTFNVLDLVGGSVTLFNYNHGVFTPSPVTISGSVLGLPSLATIQLYLMVCEPPRIVCGKGGVSSFYGAAIRVKLDVDLASVNLTAALGGLGIVGLNVQLTHLSVYATIAKVTGTLDSVDALASVVAVRARPGIVNLYVGQIDDAIFFTHVDNTASLASNLQYAPVGSVQFRVNATDISANIMARGSAVGESPTNTLLNFSGPFPQKQTVTTNPNFVTNLVSSLISSLSVQIQVNGYASLPLLTRLAIDTTLGLLSPVLIPLVESSLLSPLGLLLNSVLNPMLAVLGVRLGEADVVVLGAHRKCTYAIAGYAYQDANRNGFRDGDETGTGLELYAKLVDATVPAGPALQQVTINPTTGAYSFSNVKSGSYHIILSANMTLADVTPVAVPAGWTATEQPTRLRIVVVARADLSGQNFGLAPFTSLSGLVFLDTGTGGGTANDGLPNGGETGQAGITLRLLDQGGSVLDSTQTAADGTYRLYLPAALTTGAVLRVVETNAPNGFSTGGSAGDTGGTYTLATDTVTFTYTAGGNYTGVNFADVPVPQLTTDGQQSTLPGSTVTYAHQFIAGTDGEVTFGLSHLLDPAGDGWTETLHLDANGNGQIDPGEALVNGSITVSAGQMLNLVIKVFAPATAPHGAHNKTVLSAQFVLTGTIVPLSLTLTRTDLTVISEASSAGLKLVKTVDKAQARPGDTLVYSIVFTNMASGPMQQIVLTDMTPAFTRFVSASAGSLPAGFTLDTLTQPAAGGTGALRWTFSGPFPPGGSGTVTFTVTVNQ